MKQAIVLFAILAVANCTGVWKGGLRVRFDVGLSLGTSYFISLPRTGAAAVTEGLTLTERPEGPYPTLHMYCYPDRILCLLFDDTETVAGLQVALPVDQWTSNVYDMETTGFQRWTPSVPTGENTTTYWAIQQYFISEESASRSYEERMATRNVNQIVENGGVWVTGISRALVNVANNTADMDNSDFTKQACIPWMGRHYYYKMSANTSCTDEPLFPWFPMVDSGELIATGFMAFGKLTLTDSQRNWFENPNTSAVQAIVPSGPQCLYDLATAPGVLTMHIYYVEEPWLVTCIGQ